MKPPNKSLQRIGAAFRRSAAFFLPGGPGG